MSELSSPYTYSSALGAGTFPAGTYHIDLIAGTAAWSDGLYRLHGYERGEVVPTIELILSHKHPEDRPRAQEIIAEVCSTGGRFSMYHRMIDGRGRLHQVVTSGEGTVDASGRVTAIGGVMVDLTATLQRETEDAARRAVERAFSTRSVIDQARGLVMGRLRVGPEEAFNLLIRFSSRTNTKLSVVAADLVALAGESAGGTTAAGSTKAPGSTKDPGSAARPARPAGHDRLDAAVDALLDGKPRRYRRNPSS